MKAARASSSSSSSLVREALREAATLLLGHFVAEARAVLVARAPEAGAAALAAIAAGRPPMEIRRILIEGVG